VPSAGTRAASRRRLWGISVCGLLLSRRSDMSAGKRGGRAGGIPPAQTGADKPALPTGDAGVSARDEETGTDGKTGEEHMQTAGFAAASAQTQQMQGIAEVGEAVKRLAPERAEFLAEIAAGGATGSQAMENHQRKMAQITQMLSAGGAHWGE